MNAYDFDVVEFYRPSDHMGAVEVSDGLKSTGWVGGLWAKYASAISFHDADAIRIKRTVSTSGPNDPIGFILRSSSEATNQNTSYDLSKTGVISVVNAGQFLFKYYETKNLAERTIPGSGALLVYALNQTMYVSSNGLLTNEDETGVARAVGICSGLPQDNIGYLGADILFP